MTKQLCQLIKPTGEISGVYLQNPLDLTKFNAGDDPFPFYNQPYLYPNSRIELLLGTHQLQWCRMPLHRSKYPFLGGIFFYPPTWDLNGIGKGNPRGINATGIFINKYHEIFGNFLLFNADGSDLTRENIDDLLHNARVAVKNDEQMNGIFIIGKMSTKTRDERRLVMEQFIDEYINKMHLMTYEIAYIIILPQILKNYVHDGFHYSNTIKTHCFTSDKRNSILLSFDDHGAKPNKNTDFQFFHAERADDYYVPAKYDQFVESHPNFKFPIPTAVEKRKMEEKNDQMRQRRAKILISNKKSRN